MALLTVNNIPVVHASIRMPRVGVWHADVKIDSTTDLSGGATIATDDGSFSLVGVIQTEGVYEGVVSARIIGGAAGLSTVLPARAYNTVDVGLVLRELAIGCGEKLSPTIAASVLATPLASWVRVGGLPGAFALQRLADQVAQSYRVLPDGTLWVGVDTYPAAPSTSFDLISRSASEARVVIASERPFLLPGVTLTIVRATTTITRKVSYVVHELEAARFRSDVWFERGTG